MCGIAGLVGLNRPDDELESTLQAMGQSIVHRGPDSSGTWIDSETRLGFVHQRLSIQDLSQLGHQPMHSQDGRFTIIFNGEIFNFLELRKELEALGQTFKGHSDTEVLVAGITHWGLDDTLKKCKGQFAIALFDKKNKTLQLVRDRLGEKPLYYGYLNNEFIFASELKAITTAHAGSKPKINLSALGSYLRYGYISAPQSIFEDIYKVEPGTIVCFRLDRLSGHEFEKSQNSFWSLRNTYSEFSAHTIQDDQEAISELDTTLTRIINQQAIADVPLGAFLSGGIDSSLVSACLQANSSKPIDTFTIGFHEKDFNEAEHAKKIAQHIGSKHHELYLNAQDTLDVVPKLPTLYDEPFADSSQIPMYLVSKLARENVTVCLSGDGGDELFAGYNRYIQTQKMFEKFRSVPAPIKKIVSSGLNSIAPGQWDNLYSNANKILGRKGGANTGVKLHKLGALLSKPDLESSYRYLCGYWQNPQDLLRQAIDEPSLTSELNFNEKFLDAAMYWDQQWYIPGDNLVKTDRASMGVSLEMRLPLLDKELVEFAWRIPNSMKVKNGDSKWLLRQLLYQYVPQSLIDRPKMGFSIPIAHWLRNELRDWCETLINRDLLERQGIFNVDVLMETYKQHLSGKFDHANKLWTVLQFQAWYVAMEY
ncbi:asparagine synthase (glutamine-hydrolyzing) [Aurantivibrio infirmus]